MNRMWGSRTDLLALTILSIPFILSKLLIPLRRRERNVDRINKMNRMYESKNRSLRSEHPVHLSLLCWVWLPPQLRTASLIQSRTVLQGIVRCNGTANI